MSEKRLTDVEERRAGWPVTDGGSKATTLIVAAHKLLRFAETGSLPDDDRIDDAICAAAAMVEDHGEREWKLVFRLVPTEGDEVRVRQSEGE